MSPPTALPAVEARGLMEAFAGWGSAATVVTVNGGDGAPRAVGASAAGPVSQDPPLIQVTLWRSPAARRVLGNSTFAVNVLSQDQSDDARRVACGAASGLAWRNDGGVPVLSGNAATIVCAPWNVYDGGDHVLLVGEVLKYSLGAARPLVLGEGLQSGANEAGQQPEPVLWSWGRSGL
ncbi:flavin reductase family protein [Arthrobacter sulfonylureivorans]|uniref:flavin reductase family protein n=1 Tax=Arthrobacter sulfonylureivorans TaxID=2486855 RepID=UPI0039E3A1FD